MITETSMMAFDMIQEDLGNRQFEVYKGFKKLEYANNTMLSKYLKLPINTVTPRTNELVKKGLIEFSHITTCPITRRKSKFWKLVE